MQKPSRAAAGAVGPPLYDGRMPLTLLAGPANAGKVARLLRALSGRARSRAGSDRAEPVGRRPRRARAPAPPAGAPRRLDRHLRRPLRRLARAAPRSGRSPRRRAARARRPARDRRRAAERPRRLGALRAGFADALLQALARARGGPARARPSSTATSARLYARLPGGARPRSASGTADLVSARALPTGSTSDFDAWHGEPVFAYGFEDLTGAEWRLLEALAGRTEVTVSLPYEPGRPAFASLQRTADDLARARGRARRGAAAALRRGRAPGARPPRAGALLRRRARGRVADRRRGPLPRGRGHARRARARRRGGARAAPRRARRRRGSRSSARASSAGARRSRPRSARSGSRTRSRATTRLAQTAVRPRAARAAPLRLARRRPARPLRASCARRTPGSPRRSVDFVEGRLRGRAVADRRARSRRAERLRGRAAAGASRRCAAQTIPSPPSASSRRAMLRAAYRRSTRRRRPTRSRRDLRALRGGRRSCWTSSTAWRALGGAVDARGRRRGARAARRVRVAPGGEPGRVAVARPRCARARAASRSSSCSASRRAACRAAAAASPFLDEDARRDLDRAAPARSAPTPVEPRPLPLLHRLHARHAAALRSCARPRPTRAARASRARSGTRSRRCSTPRTSRAGRARGRSRRSPGRSRTRRPSASACARSPRSPRATPAERRARARERLGAAARPRARARSTGDTSSRTRSCSSSSASRTTFNVTELERFADCSSAWFVERLLSTAHDRRRGRPEAPRQRRAHRALPLLRRPAEGARHRARRAGAASRTPCASCASASTTRSRACGMDMTPMQRRELDQALWRDLEALVRAEAASRAAARPAPLRGRRSAPSASPPELQRGLDLGDGLTLSGKIDRIDVDPFSARGIVQDYKSGKSAHSAARDREGAAAPDPALHARAPRPRRDRAARRRLPAARRRAQGARAPAREATRETLPGFAKNDYLDEEAFWGAGRRRARDGAAARRPHPRPATCGTTRRAATARRWCDLWPMCRVKHA